MERDVMDPSVAGPVIVLDEGRESSGITGKSSGLSKSLAPNVSKTKRRVIHSLTHSLRTLWFVEIAVRVDGLDPTFAFDATTWSGE